MSACVPHLVVEPGHHQCCQSVGDCEVGLPKWKGLHLSQHRIKRYGEGQMVEPEAPHCCHLVADREVVGFPKKMDLSLFRTTYVEVPVDLGNPRTAIRKMEAGLRNFN